MSMSSNGLRKAPTPGRRGREGQLPALWMPRVELLCRAILARGGDVVCLQEFWCKSSEYRDFVSELLGRDYDILMH